MGRQRVENLHRDLFKVTEGKRGKEQEQRSEQQVSEDRRGDRVWRIYIGIDMRKTSLKTDGETRAEILNRDLLEERERGREKKSKSRDPSNWSLKTDGETESGEPT